MLRPKLGRRRSLLKADLIRGAAGRRRAQDEGEPAMQTAEGLATPPAAPLAAEAL